MPEDDDTKEFPDVGFKLAAPKKVSAYEKERQAAEAKRLRDERETAAVLREFEDSFGGGSDDDNSSYQRPSHSFGRGGGGPAGRIGHGLQGPLSGRGGLGASMGGPPSLKGRRALNEMRDMQTLKSGSFDGMSRGADPPSRRRARGSFDDHEDDSDDEAPRSTLLLSNLPPVFKEQHILRILKAHVDVEKVEIIQPEDRFARSSAAIATLKPHVPLESINKTVVALRDKYLGFGHHLTISKHLSSGTTSLHSNIASSQRPNLPYGGVLREEPGRFLNKAPPPSLYNNMAPPDSGAFPSPIKRPAEAVVHVHPPADIQLVRAIHTVADVLLSQKDPHRALEIEALLMSKAKVQQDERFAFLFDSASPAGVYYRYLLWGPDHLDAADARVPHRIDESYDMEWMSPHDQLPFPHLVDLGDAIDDPDYQSSEEENDGDSDTETPLPEPASSGSAQKRHLLSPLQVARLTSMLAGLPTSRARLQVEEVTAITYFAIQHAGKGAGEIVDMLLLNIVRPFSGMMAARYMGEKLDIAEQEDQDPLEMGNDADSGQQHNANHTRREDDPADARMIGLLVVNDVLSAASTAGVKDAWKYRQLFETGLQNHKTFEQLSRLDKELKMGRMKAVQWKNRIDTLLALWRKTNMFSMEGQEVLEQAFSNPPPTEAELTASEHAARQEPLQKPQSAARTSKFKSNTADALAASGDEDVDGVPMDDEDIDGVPMEDLDDDSDAADAQPMAVDSADRTEGVTLGTNDTSASTRPLEPEARSSPKTQTGISLSLASKTAGSTSGQAPRKRMRAEDMFADSDED